MYEFIEEFAPQWDERQIARALECDDYREISALVEGKLPLRGS
jgi:hypothetical protein